MWADIREFVTEWWGHTYIRALIIVTGSWIAAYIGERMFRHTFLVLAQRTATDLDDQILASLRRPVYWSVLLGGLSWAIAINEFRLESLLFSIMKTWAIILWTGAAIRVGEAVLASLARRARSRSLVQRDSVPVFDIFIKIFIITAGFYGVFLAWDIDVTAWLASAGIIGIAIGFAAQDTLANLIAGIVILADAPYKVDDFIVLEKDQTLRGRVTRVGLRSTRILTLDNIEITVPNAEIGKSKIINEVGGPSVPQRIHAKVSVAYGSDTDQVIEVLSGCYSEIDGILHDRDCEVRFVSMGASGLDFELLVWISEPARRDNILSALNTCMYQALNRADIEIPYAKQDIYIKEMPGMSESTGE